MNSIHLVIGANGHLGNNLVRQLLTRGIKYGQVFAIEKKRKH